MTLGGNATAPPATMVSLNGAFTGLRALRAALPLPSYAVRDAAPKSPPVRAFQSSATAPKDYGRRISAHDSAAKQGDDMLPLQKMFAKSASRVQPMRVGLEKPQFGVMTRGPEPLSEEEFEEAFRKRPLRGYTTNFTPYTGRTVPVVGGNVQGAIRQLNMILIDNNVRRQFRNQEWFEKPTLARRRRRQERWRRKFANAVREKVQLVRTFSYYGRILFSLPLLILCSLPIFSVTGTTRTVA